MTICQMSYKKILFWVLLPLGPLILQAVPGFHRLIGSSPGPVFCSRSLVYYCTDIYHIESCSWWKIRCLQYFYTLKMIEKFYLLFIILSTFKIVDSPVLYPKWPPFLKMFIVLKHFEMIKKNDKFKLINCLKSSMQWRLANLSSGNCPFHW